MLNDPLLLLKGTSFGFVLLGVQFLAKSAELLGGLLLLSLALLLEPIIAGQDSDKFLAETEELVVDTAQLVQVNDSDSHPVVVPVPNRNKRLREAGRGFGPTSRVTLASPSNTHHLYQRGPSAPRTTNPSTQVRGLTVCSPSSKTCNYADICALAKPEKPAWHWDFSILNFPMSA